MAAVHFGPPGMGLPYGGYGDYGWQRYQDAGEGAYPGAWPPAADTAEGAYDAGEPWDADEEAEDGRQLNGHKSSPEDCETCKTRKYQDGSDEMVSFKAAGHIDPNNAAAVVMGHEQEHVSNAYQKAALGNGEVVRVNVRLKTDVCPECGRTYIAGGETTTQIRYVNEDNPYQKDLKSSDASKYRGANIDLAAG